MSSVEVLTTSNEWRRWHPAIPISHHLLAMPLPELTFDETLNHGDVLQLADLNLFDIHYRSGISSTREVASYQASLMAGARSPGPSDAPCLVETSTAHGELLLWTTTSRTGTTSLLRFSFHALNLGQIFQTPTLLSPEWTDSPQNPPPALYGRRTQRSLLPTNVKLGFQLLGFHNFGPLKFLKPNYKRCYPFQILLKPRSVPISSLFILSQTLCRLPYPNDRGRQLERSSPLLLWIYKNAMRTLPLDSPKSNCYETKSLKKNDITILRSRWCGGCHRSFISYLSPTHLSTGFKQSLATKFCMVQIFWSYQEFFQNLKKDLELLPHALKRLPADYRTIVILFLADEALLTPARISAMKPFSTSPSLLTVTIVPSIASFVDVPSINRVITCVKLLASVCLQALMDPLSNSFIYPFVALEIVSLCFVLNIEIFVHFSLNLVLIN